VSVDIRHLHVNHCALNDVPVVQATVIKMKEVNAVQVFLTAVMKAIQFVTRDADSGDNCTF
jgi:hypothetical protein